jgi:hypothetical protein
MKEKRERGKRNIRFLGTYPAVRAPVKPKRAACRRQTPGAAVMGEFFKSPSAAMWNFPRMKRAHVPRAVLSFPTTPVVRRDVPPNLPVLLSLLSEKEEGRDPRGVAAHQINAEAALPTTRLPFPAPRREGRFC